MTDTKNGGSGIIKYGYVFEDDQSLKVLAEGHGVVVVRQDGGGYVAFGKTKPTVNITESAGENTRLDAG